LLIFRDESRNFFFLKLIGFDALPPSKKQIATKSGKFKTYFGLVFNVFLQCLPDPPFLLPSNEKGGGGLEYGN